MKVLFVGNSHTFTHDVPSIVDALFKENNKDWEYKEMTVSGETLLFHSKREELLKEIANGNYDVIILQERASRFDPELFDEGFNSLYNHIINTSKSNILMYMIWSNESMPSVQRIIANSYLEATKKDRVYLAPVGIAWDIIRHNHTDIKLYMDGNHATKIGAYLAASGLFYALNNRKEKLNIDKNSKIINKLELNYDDVLLVHKVLEKVYNCNNLMELLKY